MHFIPICTLRAVMGARSLSPSASLIDHEERRATSRTYCEISRNKRCFSSPRLLTHCQPSRSSSHFQHMSILASSCTSHVHHSHSVAIFPPPSIFTIFFSSHASLRDPSPSSSFDKPIHRRTICHSVHRLPSRHTRKVALPYVSPNGSVSIAESSLSPLIRDRSRRRDNGEMVSCRCGFTTSDIFLSARSRYVVEGITRKSCPGLLSHPPPLPPHATCAAFSSAKSHKRRHPSPPSPSKRPSCVYAQHVLDTVLEIPLLSWPIYQPR